MKTWLPASPVLVSRNRRNYARGVFCILAASAFAACWPEIQAHGSSQQTYLDCLEDFQRYAETIWTSASYANAPADAGYWGDGNSSGNGGIRGNCGVAVSYAVLVRAYPGATNRVARLERIRQALNYAANSHVSGTNVCVDQKKWGHGWQTALWAGSMGLACLLVQTDLPPVTVQAVQRATADEASYRAGIRPASGYAGDTKAEENGWNANVVALAAAWLSADPAAGLWLDSAKEYLANTYTVANTNGDSLAPWLSTVTLYPDFSLENHGFYHPTYQMVAGMSMGDSLLMARLANPATGVQLQPFAEHNVLNVWTNLQHLVLDSGEFAYPSGLDWELHDYEQNSYVAWLAAHFDDSLARFTDAQLARLTRYRQIINGDGRFVGPSGGGFFREAVEARRTAIAWLHWADADYPTGLAVPPETSFEHLSTVKIIAQRGPFGFFSLSYGPNIMAVIEPPAEAGPTNAYITTPRLPGIMGLGALGNPTAARLVALATNSGRFEAQLELTHGTNGTTQVYVSCTGETIAIVEVPWPAPGVSGGNSGSFSVGIENDPLTGGWRRLDWTDAFAFVTNRSGATQTISNSWVCVAGRYGFAAGPSGCFRYQAAGSYNRPGAAQDTLEFVALDKLGPRYAVWFPGQNAAQTASNANRISWSATGPNGVLTFPGAAGGLAQISVPLSSGAPPYPPYPLPISEVQASSFQASYPPTNAVDGDLSDFWVSLLGPTNHAEWLKVIFPRLVAVSGFQVYPRTQNGGYGPRDIQLILNVTNAIPAEGIPTSGTPVYAGTMEPTSPLDVRLSAPVAASNAVLVISSAYDRGDPANPRNVQVVEMIFFERARAGTYGDWALHEFTDAELADPAVGSPSADPDKDGVRNLAEFAAGGNPSMADAVLAALTPESVAAGSFRFRFRQRPDLGDVQRVFEGSTDLLNWASVLPSELTAVSPAENIFEAAVPMRDGSSYYRLRFILP